MHSLALAVTALLSSLWTQQALSFESIGCADGKTVFAIRADGSVLRKTPDGWLPWVDLGHEGRAHAFWQSPDDVLYVIGHDGRDAVVAELSNGSTRRWGLPQDRSSPRFAFLNGPAVVTERILGLGSRGELEDRGPAPTGISGFIPHIAPVLISNGPRRIACFGTSVAKADSTDGHCVAQDPPKYDYRVDFDWVGNISPPFGCAGDLISVEGDKTQARRLSDGKLEAKIVGAALKGSRCIGDAKLLWVGKREVRLYDLPTLRQRGMHRFGRPIQSTALCGDTLVVLPPKDPSLTSIPLSDLSERPGRRGDRR